MPRSYLALQVEITQRDLTMKKKPLSDGLFLCGMACWLARSTQRASEAILPTGCNLGEKDAVGIGDGPRGVGDGDQLCPSQRNQTRDGFFRSRKNVWVVVGFDSYAARAHQWVGDLQGLCRRGIRRHVIC